MRFCLPYIILLSTTGCYAISESTRGMLTQSLPVEDPGSYDEIRLSTAGSKAIVDQAALELEASHIESLNDSEGSKVSTNHLNRDHRIIDLIESTDDPELQKLLASKLPTAEPARIEIDQAEIRSDEPKKTEPPIAKKTAHQSGSEDAIISTASPNSKQDLDSPASKESDLTRLLTAESMLNSIIQQMRLSKQALTPEQSTSTAESSPAESNCARCTASLESTPLTKEKDSFQSEQTLAGNWKDELRSTILMLEESLYSNELANDEQATLQIYLRLLHLIENDKQRATLEILELSEEDQAFWENQMKALSTLLDRTAPLQGAKSVSSSDATDDAMKHLQNAIQQLSRTAELQIQNVAFCREVSGIGQFDEFESSEFKTNQQVLIYCELDNFTTTPITRDGMTIYESDMKGRLNILNEQNESVYEREYDTVHDSARRPRRDFFMYFPVTIPELVAGEYRLQLEVADVGGKKKGLTDQPIPFSVR